MIYSFSKQKFYQKKKFYSYESNLKKINKFFILSFFYEFNIKLINNKIYR
jgi:hypothetical protein